jgi:hypothetical protein
VSEFDRSVKMDTSWRAPMKKEYCFRAARAGAFARRANVAPLRARTNSPSVVSQTAALSTAGDRDSPPERFLAREVACAR